MNLFSEDLQDRFERKAREIARGQKRNLKQIYRSAHETLRALEDDRRREIRDAKRIFVEG